MPKSADRLLLFMQQPGVDITAKEAVSMTIEQAALHGLYHRQDAIAWYQAVLEFYLHTDVANVIDTDLIGSMLCETLSIGAEVLLPTIAGLYSKGIVADQICGTYEEVSRDMSSTLDLSNKIDVLTPEEIYAELNSEYEDEIFENSEQSDFTSYESEVNMPVKSNKTVGRNDPCICGSGKKYKKCCL
jgi:hypothetical protein